MNQIIKTALLAGLMAVSGFATAKSKLIVKAGERLPQSVNAELVADYGSFQLMTIDPAQRHLITLNHNVQLVEEMNSLLFDSYRIDTQEGNLKD